MSRIIAGTTRVLGIVGDPIAQVRAPEVWTGLSQRNGIDAVCVPMHVAPNALESFLLSIGNLKNLVGLIITVPHKATALRHVVLPTERAKRVGAVNLVRWNSQGVLQGDIVDGIGFVHGLVARNKDLTGKRVIVVGAGGAGTAIAFAVAEAGAAEVAVTDIDFERANELVRRLVAAGYSSRTSPAVARGFDVIVNASPIGMRSIDQIPIDCEGLLQTSLVADAIMHPPVTKLLEHAATAGCFTQPGTYMMDYQIAESARFFGFERGDWSPQAICEVMQTSS